MITPVTYNIHVYKSRDFDVTFTLTDSNDDPIDLSSSTIEAQIRKSKDTNSDLITDLTVTETDLVNGEFKLSLTDTETADFEIGEGFYDVCITDASGISYTYIEGSVSFHESVTVKA